MKKWFLILIVLALFVGIGKAEAVDTVAICPVSTDPNVSPKAVNEIAPTPNACPVPNVSLWVSPSTINPGGYTTISWSSDTAWSCNSSWAGTLGTNGSMTVGPYWSNTSFSISCTNDNPTAGVGYTTVYIAAPPPPPPAPTVYQCSDGKNNDDDLLIDMGDPGCTSTTDNDESNPIPIPDVNYYQGSIVPDPQNLNLISIPAIGCAKVGDGISYTRPGRTLWKFLAAVTFCWDGAKVSKLYSHNIVRETTSVPFPLSLYQGWQSSASFTLLGVPGSYNAIVRADGEFKYCAFKYGCLNIQQPWIKIMPNHGGTATCITSARNYNHACQRFAGP